MFRKVLLLFLIPVLALTIAVPMAAAAPEVVVNNNKLNFEVLPKIENGHTLVPLRAIFEALNAKVEWNGATETVMATKGNTRINLPVGKATASKNGESVNLEVPAKIIKSKTMVPLRFVSEALGAGVNWNGKTQTITINSGPKTAPKSTEKATVHFLNVGQADSIYIELANNNDILIDAGNQEDGSYVVNYLKQQGVDNIELLIATHPHEDHIGGIPDILNAFEVQKIIDSGYLTDTQTCQEYSTKVQAEDAVYQHDNNRTYNFGDVKLEVLTGTETWDDTNDYSVVARLDTGDIEFLFTGDAEKPAELALSGNLEAEVLKVAHHGSNSSSSASFLDKVGPEVSVVSVGEDNRYGHPSSETIQRLYTAGSEVYCTDDTEGNVVVTTNGQNYDVNIEDQVKPVKASQQQVQQPEQTSQSDTQKNVIIQNINLSDEIAAVKNNSSQDVNLSGWQLVSIKGNQTYTFPNSYTLKAGATVYITSGRGAKHSPPQYLKWSGAYIWNNDGDSGALYNSNGELVMKLLK